MSNPAYCQGIYYTCIYTYIMLYIYTWLDDFRWLTTHLELCLKLLGTSGSSMIQHTPNIGEWVEVFMVYITYIFISLYMYLYTRNFYTSTMTITDLVHITHRFHVRIAQNQKIDFALQGPWPQHQPKLYGEAQAGNREEKESIYRLVLSGKSWKICKKLGGFWLFPQKPWGFLHFSSWTNLLIEQCVRLFSCNK